MKDIVYTINQFKETIIVNTIVAILVIAISTVMLCIWRKKSRLEGSKLFKAWWIVVLLLVVSCMKFIMLIPAFVDIHTNAIEVVEISNCDRQHNTKSVGGLARSRITFTTVDGKRMIGYFIENVEISDQSHGYILYAKHSRYILDCDLYE